MYENTHIDEDGIMLFLKKNDNGFAVGIKDLDAGEVFPSVRVFADKAQAMAFYKATKAKM